MWFCLIGQPLKYSERGVVESDILLPLYGRYRAIRLPIIFKNAGLLSTEEY